jgi:OmpA-OmpF porin, OOP family
MRTKTPVKQKCRICGFDGNPSDARRCMVCDEKLEGNSIKDSLLSPFGILGGIALISLCVFGYYSFNSLTGGSQSRLEATGTEANQDTASAVNNAGAAPIAVTTSADSWAGYFWLRQGADPNSVFGKILSSKGISLKYEDEPDQSKRAQKLSAGTYDIAMTTADQVLMNSFGGRVVTMVDVSAGGDALVLRNGLKSITDVQDGMKVAYARATPSETLYRVIESRFALENKRFKVLEVKVADEAWALLKDGKVDMAIIWQPFTGLARRAGLAVPITSADAKNTILDVMVASNAADPEKVKKFVSAYCEAADYYISRPEELKRAVGVDSKVSGQELVDLAEGIYFVPCREADRIWFRGGLFEQRKTVITELVGAKRGQEILDPKPIEYFTGKQEARLKTLASLDPNLFKPLSAKEAGARPVIQTLRAEKVNFDTNSALLTAQGKKELDLFIADLKNFPSIRVLVEGHTSSIGNPRDNQNLSQARANAVVNYFVGKGYPRSRFNAIGYGASRPLPNTSSQSYVNRRTEIKLIR